MACCLEQDRDPHAHCQGDGKQDHIVPVSQYAVMDPEPGKDQRQQPSAKTRQPVHDAESCLQETQKNQQGDF